MRGKLRLHGTGQPPEQGTLFGLTHGIIKPEGDRGPMPDDVMQNPEALPVRPLPHCRVTVRHLAVERRGLVVGQAVATHAPLDELDKLGVMPLRGLVLSFLASVSAVRVAGLPVKPALANTSVSDGTAFTSSSFFC